MTSLRSLLNQVDYDFYLPVVDPALDMTDPGLDYFYTLSPAQFGLSVSNSGLLLSHPKVINYLQTNSANNHHQVAIVPFKSSAKIEYLCRQYHWFYLAPPASLCRQLENKIEFPKICLPHHLPLIPSAVDKLNPKNFKKYQKQYGPKLIIQSGFGWAGKSTFSCRNYSQIPSKFPSGSLVKFMPYLPGQTYTNNCCLSSFGLIQSPPANQLTGQAGYTANPFATVGRSWPCTSSASVQQQIRSISHRFGQILQSFNFRGYFGLDFHASGQQVYLLECNPRLTASFAFYHRFELNSDYSPLFFLHLASFLPLNYSLNYQFELVRLSCRFTGSQITPRDSQGQITTKIETYG